MIDKRTLEVVKALTPAPGKTAAHIEFDRYGKYALASIWEIDGAIVVYDAATLRGGEAHPGEQAGRQVQRLQQGHPLGGDEPLIGVGTPASPFTGATGRNRATARDPSSAALRRQPSPTSPTSASP